MLRSLRAMIVGCCACLAPWALAADFTLYAYHLKPPFIIDADKRQGLYFDMAAYLTERMPGHTFQTVYVPRRRLELDLETGRLKGLVLGVHPLWFKDESRTRFHWTPAVLHDEDVVVSRRDKPVNYEGPDSLVGKKLGLVGGYYYFGVDELIRAGRIEREDSFDESANLGKLLLGRLDVTIVTRRTLEYLQRHQPEWKGKFHIAAKPHDSFDRFILIPKDYAQYVSEITAALGGIERDPVWRAKVESYR
jgi:polar amino acid transport system substrate-binding protein